MTSSPHPHDPWWLDEGYQTNGLWDSIPGPFRWGRQLGGGRVPDTDFTGIAKVAAVVGVCVLGYFVYRHIAVVGGTARGIKQSVSEGVA
jgi:hypothetical protein